MTTENDKPHDQFFDPDVLKFRFECPHCSCEHFHELTDQDIEAGNIGLLRICDECVKKIVNFSKHK